MLFRDRYDAGRVLASHLAGYLARPDVLVLALPRGGVPVAYEIALALHAPLDVVVVRKLGTPGHEELAMGAVARGVRIVNDAVVRDMHISPTALERVIAHEQAIVDWQETELRGNLPPVPVSGRSVILVDDGLATGSSMQAALAATRAQQPGALIIAVPVASREAFETVRREATDAICVNQPEEFYGVCRWYRDFSQVSDERVRELLALSRAALTGGVAPTDDAAQSHN